MRLSERELEAYEDRAREGGVSLAELFDRASNTIERNMARAAEASRRTLH